MAFLVYGGVGMKEKVGCQRTATAKKLLGIYGCDSRVPKKSSIQ
jgi:hypothetical protein